MKINTISPKELHDLYQQETQIDLIDVRTPIEFREIHAVLAHNIPLDSLAPHSVMKRRSGSAEEPLYLICKSGSRGSKACEKFIKEGYANVVNVEGGTMTWDESGLPVNRGKKAMSLERQVRIAAGFIVLLGALLGIFVHSYFAGISAFVGAGLMFAGITDSCAMGMLIAKMPWNQCQDGSCSV